MSFNEKYEVLCQEVSNGLVPVTKYKSKRTGLTICLAEVEGPLVNGFFCLATEAHDDDGLPHTLEHLIFLGSEDYPYKGVLDMMANRCLAQGTNAWTDTDHTCYTVMTAGSQGFLNLMPVYLDHVLYPTLTDAAYVTEVHHVNGEGENAGVVYCEMQARENSGESRCHLAMLRQMYPGHCGYKSETGGIMANLRTSTSNQKVRDYHKSFYRPDNLCLVITGQVSAEEVFKALDPFEDKIVSKGSLPPHTRPWMSAVPPLEAPIDQVVPYPSDDESNGLVYAAWRGPQAKDLYGMSAVSVLLEYLTDTSVAPLQRDFVEINDPYCSNVRNSVIEATESCIYLKFYNVPKAKLHHVKERLFQTLGNLADGTESMDMSRMKSVVHRKILDALNSMEDRPHDTLAFMCIGDFLYGTSQEELRQRLNDVDDFKKLKDEVASFWTDLLQKYFVGPPSVVIVGDPSKQVAEEMASEEKERIKKQQEELGEAGLKKMAEIVDAANQENEREAPGGMIGSLPIPSTASIHFHPLHRHSNLNGTVGPTEIDISKLPFTFQLDHVHSNFVQLKAVMDTSAVDENLRMYLPLYSEIIFESPVLRSGTLIPYKEVVTQLAADTLQTNSRLGVLGRMFRCGFFSQLAFVEIKVEEEKYAAGVNWLQEILCKTQFTKERLNIVATKMVNEVAQLKRDGRTVVLAVLKDMNFGNDSNHYLTSMVRQHGFLSKLLEQLEKEPDQVIADMNKLRAALTAASNLRVHMTSNIEHLSKVTEVQLPWQQQFVDQGIKTDAKCKVLQKRAFQMVRSNQESKPMGQIIGVGSVESSYFVQTVPCMNDFKDPDLPALMVYLECLCALEGPMWKQIRGLGLAYHYRMYIKPEEGLLYLQLFKCTHVVNAYRQAKTIVEGYLNKSTLFDNLQVETAISSVLYEIIEREETVSSVSDESLMNYFRNSDKDYNRNLLTMVSKVTIDDLLRVGEKYIRPLIDPSKARCAVCCQPSKVKEITEGFKGLSRDLHVLNSLEEAFGSA
ncbi:uncharacterized protein C05D11.1-like [Apostichopus japonicus]|uniref:uncharacterized protein C05D11.1-like n=1 Tax=Stichopus japonicus TaxID=307972 RepID=UPI003AB1F220